MEEIKRSSEILYPADVYDILESYGDIMDSHINHSERNSVYARFKKTETKLDVLFPLKEHPIHGITCLHVREVYTDGYVREYQYQWKIIVPKQGILTSHISAWGNEPHDDPDIPEEFIVATEPHHHHHVPGDRKQRQESYDVRSLEDAFEFVAYYIRSGQEYKP